MQWSYWFAVMLDARPSDRMYNCLPMYHRAGGVGRVLRFVGRVGRDGQASVGLRAYAMNHPFAWIS